ncbi:transposase (plasmid) [Pararobbsia alpina]|uniref:hypothetical protein n=1 Tax=Pararobbsia alpina TaxID=621374 RepID=UPI0039A6E748
MEKIAWTLLEVGMQKEEYKGYVLWGHAMARRAAVEAGNFWAASGTVTKDRELVGASGVLEVFEEEFAAEEAGIAWAREWVDKHG